MEKPLLPYLLFEPSKNKAPEKNKTLIFFHGSGSNNETLRPVAPYFNECRLLLPLAPLKTEDNTYDWFDFKDNSLEIDRESLRLSLEKVKHFIADIRKKHPHESIYIGGFSQGGILGYELFLEDPDYFAGMFCLSGFLPKCNSYPLLVNKPILITHGKQDPILPVDNAYADADKLKEQGAKVTYQVYETGHEISGETLTDVASWLKEIQ